MSNDQSRPNLQVAVNLPGNTGVESFALAGTDLTEAIVDAVLVNLKQQGINLREQFPDRAAYRAVMFSLCDAVFERLNAYYVAAAGHALNKLKDAIAARQAEREAVALAIANKPEGHVPS